MSTTTATRYPAYRQREDEEVEWFDAPIFLGVQTNVPGGRRVVAVGITDLLGDRTGAALIVGLEGHLSRLLRMATWENDLNLRVALEPAAVKELKRYRIQVTAS